MDADQFNQFFQVQQSILTQLVEQSKLTSPNPSLAGTQQQSTDINTALLPNFDIFDENKESFRNYKHQFSKLC